MGETYTAPAFAVTAPQLDDVPGLVDLWEQAHPANASGSRPLAAEVELHGLGSDTTHKDLIQDITAYREVQETNPGHQLWRVARDAEGNVAGDVQGRGTAIACDLLYIRVAPIHQDTRLAYDLAGELFAWARETHPDKPVRVSVLASDTWACRFYEGLGFEVANLGNDVGGGIIPMWLDAEDVWKQA